MTTCRATFLAIALTLALPGWLVAGPFEDGLAAYQRQDYAAALKFWRPLAEQGHAKAQHNLGLMYYSSRGVPQDFAEAAMWYRMAAEQGNATAQWFLGVTYYTGRGVLQDHVAAGPEELEGLGDEPVGVGHVLDDLRRLRGAPAPA